jgi:hypothetical protein
MHLMEAEFTQLYELFKTKFMETKKEKLDKLQNDLGITSTELNIKNIVVLLMKLSQNTGQKNMLLEEYKDLFALPKIINDLVIEKLSKINDA